ncbi:MAG TPA: hypothetical protein VNO30_07960 [Kofleriaceae bacterium]|nr:hypothetical protein [Kofleriaceae bacterium]
MNVDVDVDVDVDLIFYDTTSLHFEVDGAAAAAQSKGDRPTQRSASAATRRTGARTPRRPS